VLYSLFVNPESRTPPDGCPILEQFLHAPLNTFPFGQSFSDSSFCKESLLFTFLVDDENPPSPPFPIPVPLSGLATVAPSPLIKVTVSPPGETVPNLAKVFSRFFFTQANSTRPAKS